METAMTERIDEAPAAASASMVEVAQSRVAQEVQAQIVMARKFPRDTEGAFARIMRNVARREYVPSSRSLKMFACPFMSLASAVMTPPEQDQIFLAPGSHFGMPSFSMRDVNGRWIPAGPETSPRRSR